MKKIVQTFNRDKIVKDILDILSIQSFTNNPIGITKCQNFVISLAKQMGFEVSKHGKGKVLVISPKSLSDAPMLGIVVHLDTVPFVSNQWTYNPLGEIANNRIYGRGVLDDKAAIILSMHALKNLEHKINPSWQIIVGSSEESKWTDIEDFLKEKPELPSFMITIDGDGVQNGCRGCLNLVLKFMRTSNTKNLEQLFIPEGVENIVPDKAITVINNHQILETGFSVHSSIPEKGQNAFSRLIRRLSLYNSITCEFPYFFRLMELLEKGNCAQLLGFAPDTSICPTKCNLIEDTISVNFNIRLGPLTTQNDLFGVLDQILQNYHCTMDISSLTFPSYVSKESKEIKLMCHAYYKVIGKATIPNIARGLGYNATFPNCAIFGPRFAPEDDEPDTCHGIDENRKIEDLLKFLDMLSIFIYELLK